MNQAGFWKRVDRYGSLHERGILSDRDLVDAILDEVTAVDRPATLEEVHSYLAPQLREILIVRLRQIRAENWRGWFNFVGPGMSEADQAAAAHRLQEIVEAMERSGIVNFEGSQVGRSGNTSG